MERPNMAPASSVYYCPFSRFQIWQRQLTPPKQIRGMLRFGLPRPVVCARSRLRCGFKRVPHLLSFIPFSSHSQFTKLLKARTEDQLLIAYKGCKLKGKRETTFNLRAVFQLPGKVTKQ